MAFVYASAVLEVAECMDSMQTMRAIASMISGILYMLKTHSTIQNFPNLAQHTHTPVSTHDCSIKGF